MINIGDCYQQYILVKAENGWVLIVTTPQEPPNPMAFIGNLAQGIKQQTPNEMTEDLLKEETGDSKPYKHYVFFTLEEVFEFITKKEKV